MNYHKKKQSSKLIGPGGDEILGDPGINVGLIWLQKQDNLSAHETIWLQTYETNVFLNLYNST